MNTNIRKSGVVNLVRRSQGQLLFITGKSDDGKLVWSNDPNKAASFDYASAGVFARHARCEGFRIFPM